MDDRPTHDTNQATERPTRIPAGGSARGGAPGRSPLSGGDLQNVARSAERDSRANPAVVLTDVATLRARARSHIEQGAITLGARGNRALVLELLDAALATELVCVLRY